MSLFKIIDSIVLNERKLICWWISPFFRREVLCVEKISWWLDIPMSMTPFWETLEGKLARIWSIKVEVLQVTRVGHFSSCFKPRIVQNWWYIVRNIARIFNIARNKLLRNHFIITNNVFVVLAYVHIKITKYIQCFHISI